MKFTIILLFLTVCTIAQTNEKIVYTYSSSGNRIQRKFDNVNPFRVGHKDSTSSAKEFQQIVKNEGISVYPNPTSGKVVLTINNFDSKETNTMSLLDAKGNIIITQPLTDRVSEMNIAELRSGIYLIQLIKNDKMLYYKLVKTD